MQEAKLQPESVEVTLNIKHKESGRTFTYYFVPERPVCNRPRWVCQEQTLNAKPFLKDAERRLRGKRSRCTCWTTSVCWSVRGHSCICLHGTYNPCLAKEHECACFSTYSGVICRAVGKHPCSCIRDGRKCLAERLHECTCYLVLPSFCRSTEHGCYCQVDIKACKSVEHRCCCHTTENTIDCLAKKHACICEDGHDHQGSTCRSTE